LPAEVVASETIVSPGDEYGKHVVSFVPVRRVVIPKRITEAVATHVESEHPHEAGGFLGCERRGGHLHATDHVPLPNDADRPRRRFVTTVDERVPPEPRICYHSHTSPATVSGMTKIDRQKIPERYALVVFAPHGDPYSYRVFQRTLLRWRELPVGRRSTESDRWIPLPRLS
jgi:proteasome lid subunit RPN8/RPN11